MSEMVPVVDAQWSAPGQLLAEFALEDQHTPWKDYVRKLEAEGHMQFVPAGTALTAGKVYIDLLQPCKGPIRALQGQMAGSRNRYLAQDEVPVKLWYAIIEHCACVDRETGQIPAIIDVPSRRRTSAGLTGVLPAIAA